MSLFYYVTTNTPSVANGLWVELQRSCPAATTSYVWWKYRPKTDGIHGPSQESTSWRTIISTFVKGGSVLRMILEEDHSSSAIDRYPTGILYHRVTEATTASEDKDKGLTGNYPPTRTTTRLNDFGLMPYCLRNRRTVIPSESSMYIKDIDRYCNLPLELFRPCR